MLGIDTSVLHPTDTDAVRRIEARTHYAGDCMVFDGAHHGRARERYAHIKIGGLSTRISRYLCCIVHDRSYEDSSWMARHLCGNCSCINPNHLVPGDAASNAADAIRHGTLARGTRIANAKLTEQQVISIRADKRTYQQIADAFGLASSTVGAIKRRETWTHLASEEGEQ